MHSCIRAGMSQSIRPSVRPSVRHLVSQSVSQSARAKSIDSVRVIDGVVTCEMNFEIGTHRWGDFTSVRKDRQSRNYAQPVGEHQCCFCFERSARPHDEVDIICLSACLI